MPTERRTSTSYRQTAAETFGVPQQHTRARSAERTNEYKTAEEIMPHQLDVDDVDEEFMIATAGFVDDDDDNEPVVLLESTSSGQHHKDHGHGNRPRLASDTSISRQLNNGIRRANSDPFECAGEEDIDQLLEHKLRRTSIIEEEDSSLPTLNRFPFGETKNQKLLVGTTRLYICNAWSELFTR